MIKTAIILLAIQLTVVATLVSEPYSVEPELIDTVETEGYRRIWGSPEGAFFLLKKSGAEIRQYPGADIRNINVRGTQKLISSERGNYYALISYSNFLPTQLQVTAVSVYERSGELLWTKEGPGCNAFIMCDNAPLLVGIEGAEGFPESRLVFFNSSGETVGNAKVQNFYNGQFCESGDYFFGISGAGSLLKFTNSGKLVHDYGRAIRYHSSFDGKLIAVVGDTATTIFSDANSIVTWPVSQRSLREIRFSRDNAFVAALYGDRLNVFDITANSRLAEHTLDDAAYRFFRFDTDPNFNYFVCGASNSADTPEARNTRGRIMLLGAGGNLLWGEEVVYEEWSVKFPDVRLDSSRRLLSLLTASTLQVFKF